MLRYGLALTFLVPLVLAAPGPASAASGGFYATADGAQATCPSEEVVWLDLAQSRYYHKTQPSYGKSGGVYACITAARAKAYREAKEAASDTAKSG
ncbi:MAG TPA: hypothetical protein VKS60_25855 [Stellaceae bacterium]|nr:hypothetical protein [Stellaceae bacterium]